MDNWFFIILCSALALGLYDFAKKTGVQNNRVMPVLFIATAFGTLSLIAISIATGRFVSTISCTWQTWCLVFLKSCLVSASWIAGYFALHDMPISIVAPIRTSSSVWATLGGLVLLGECPTLWQAVAMCIIFAGYFCFSVIGKAEGFSRRNRGIKMVIAATLLGAASGIYDRVLMHRLHLPVDTVQLHFSIDLLIIIGICWLLQPHCKFLREDSKFTWRWCIPAIGLLLILSDWLYFNAVANPDAQIGMLSILRRMSVCVSFFCGGCFLHEKYLLKKTCALLLLLIGVVLFAMVK